MPLVDLSNTIRRIGGDECAKNINEAYIETADLLDWGQGSLVGRDFNTCFSVEYFNDFDVATFFSGITTLLSDFVNIYGYGQS